MKKTTPNHAKLDQIVAQARKQQEEREQGYRAQALKLYPWICGRCRREFSRANLHELTVHHRDHDHNNNPSDGSNWELLCLYCHDNEHARRMDAEYGSLGGDSTVETSTFSPFADLKALLDKGKKV